MNSRTLRRVIFAFGALLTLSGCAKKEAWKLKAFNDGGFSALMPAEPSVTKKVENLGHYSSEYTKYLTTFGEANRRREYDVYFLKTIIPDSNRKRFTEIVDSSKFSRILFDAQRQAFEEENYQLLGWSNVASGKYAGREMDMLASDKVHVVFVRAFQKGYNVYMITAKVPIDHTEEA